MTPRRIVACFALVAATLGAGATAAGAGGSKSSSTSAKQWANSLCSALQDFGDSVHSTLDGLKSASSLDGAVQQAEQGLQSAVDDLQKSLDDLGKPPTPNAKQAQSAVQNLGTELDTDVDDIQSALTPSPTTAQEAASAFAQIGGIIQKGINQTESTVATLQSLKGNNALKKGFQSASSCQQLQQSS